MSRFTLPRVQSIAIWTGAAVTWGAALTAHILEPARDEPTPLQSPVIDQLAASVDSVMPAVPSSGLVIIRHEKPEIPAPRTVYVQQPSATPAQTAQASAAPQPKSSGS
jgi:hypothetical protein